MKSITDVLFEALVERGWHIHESAQPAIWPAYIYEDPEGNKWGTLEGALLAQVAREVSEEHGFTTEK